MLTDSPYNVRRASAKPSSEQDVTITSGMTEMLDLTADYLKMGGHGIVFCSDLQFLPWTEDLKVTTDFVTLKDMNRRGRTQEEAVLGFENKSLGFVRDKNKSTQHSSGGSVHHVNMTEHTVHFWRMGLGPEELLNSVDFYVPPLYSKEFFPTQTLLRGFIVCFLRKLYSRWTRLHQKPVILAKDRWFVWSKSRERWWPASSKTILDRVWWCYICVSGLEQLLSLSVTP